MIDVLAGLTSTAAASAFRTMGGGELELRPIADVTFGEERCVTSSVKYQRPVAGIIHRHATSGLAHQVSATMLSQPRSSEIPDDPVADTMGEFTNMVIAKIQSRLTDRGVPCVITPPQVTWHPHFTARGAPGPRCRTLSFTSAHGPLLIELILQ